MAKQFFSFERGLGASPKRRAGVALPGSKGIRNARGEVVVPLLGKGWLGSNVQYLSAGGRGLLVELLMRLASGMGVSPASELQACLNLDSAELNQLVDELVLGDLVELRGSSLVVKPEVTRELLMGRRVVGEDGGS